MARILVIDDDLGLRDLLSLLLTSAGHEVVTACNGMEGVLAFRAAPADVVLVDMMMPYDGLMTIRILCDQFPKVGIIAMSGGASHRLDYARSLGARRTLTKPFAQSSLLAAVDGILARNGTVEPWPVPALETAVA